MNPAHFMSTLALLALAPSAGAQTASALLREGDELLPGETISFLNNTAVNHVGGYACSLSTTGTGTISRIWGDAAGGPGVLLRSESTIGNLEQTSFESFYGMGDGGELCYGTTCNDLDSGETGLDGVWLDDTVVLNELDAVPSLPGQFSTFNSRPTSAGDGVPVWVGGIADTSGGSTQNRCLFSGLDADVLLMGGDFLPGIADAVTTATAGVDFSFRVSRFRGHWINETSVLSGSSDDAVMIIDGEPITAGGVFIREGTVIPAVLGGTGGEAWAGFDLFGINEAGDYLITGNTSGPAATDEYVALNGELIVREGDVLDLALAPVTIAGAIEGASMNEQADWAATWDIDDGQANREALIVSGQIVLVEGDLVDWNGDGTIDGLDNNGKLANFTGITTLTLGPRIDGVVDAYFTADIDFLGTPTASDDLEGFFRITAVVDDCPWDCADDNGIVGINDFLELLAQWGQPGTSCDFNGDGTGIVDFLALLANWGPCS